MRKSKTKILVSSLILTILILLAAIIIIATGKKMIDDYKIQIADMQYEMDANKQTVYVASENIVAGMTLEEDVNVYKQQIYTGLESDSYMQEEDMGSIAIIDIPMGEPIMRNEITPLYIAKDTREYEISVAALMTDQSQYEYVDVRIMFPNGEDYIVLSKKPVLNMHLENCVFYTYLNEDEILRIASATIDAYTISGTRIYTTRYVEQNIQDEAVPNYVVSAETIDLINSDPNITSIATETMNLEARMDLESRLLGLTEDQLKAVSSGHELTDTAKNAVLIEDTYNETQSLDNEENTPNLDNEENTTDLEEETSEEADETITKTTSSTAKNTTATNDIIE